MCLFDDDSSESEGVENGFSWEDNSERFCFFVVGVTLADFFAGDSRFLVAWAIACFLVAASIAFSLRLLINCSPLSLRSLMELVNAMGLI